MRLMGTLNQCISTGHEITKIIVIAQFSDDNLEARKITRRWRIGETADLAGVSSQAIRDVEEAGRLPHPDMEIRGRVEQRAGYTIEQINHMYNVSGMELRRAEDMSPPVIGVAVYKGDVYKTPVSVHLAQDLALKGLRVLLVEGNDPQGTTSVYHGWASDPRTHTEDTLLPFYFGEKNDITYAIKPACWPGLNIISSCLTLHRIGTELMGKFDEGKLPIDPHLILRLAIETIAHDCDVIVIGSVPSLGIGTINIVRAVGVLTAPMPAESFDYTSALQFSDMPHDLPENVDLKGSEPGVRTLLTEYSNNNGSQPLWMEEQTRDAWGSMVLKNVVRGTGETGKGQIRMRTVLEQVIDQHSSAGAWRNTLPIWESVCNEIFSRLIKPRWEIK